MKSAFIAVPAILASIAAAVPVEKRGVVWTSITQEEWVTVPVTTTVWVEPGSSASAAEFHPSASNWPYHSHSAAPAPASSEVPSVISSVAAPTSTVAPVAPPAPTSTSSSSSFVAPPPTPTPSSTSVVAPAPVSTAAPVTSAAAPSSAPAQAQAFPAFASIVPFSPPTTFTDGSPIPAITSGVAVPGASFPSMRMTYYTTGEGSCGWSNEDTNNIVAVDYSMFDEYTPTSGIHSGNPNYNPLCGKSITISYGSASFPAVIADKCPGCPYGGLDLSPNLFAALMGSEAAAVAAGTEQMTWSFDS